MEKQRKISTFAAMNKGKELLKNLKFYEGYSKYNTLLERKETWAESVDDVMSMHYKKFRGNKALLPYLKEATESYKNYQVLASQRNLQFRGKEIEKHNEKIFNCASTFIDRVGVFKQIMEVLLCGCGMGYSVESRFVNKLPAIKSRKDDVVTHFIEDSIEGWALAIDALMKSYFEGSEKIRFDYSLIRQKGAFISGGFKAPGHEPLKKSLELIESLIDNLLKTGANRLSTLDTHDIICHISDAVLSGGVRRSALIALFGKDDELMLKCKTGNWFYDNPQRGRANNSIKLLKSELTKEELDYYMESIKEFGEPGIVLVDDIDFCTNPCCFTGDSKLLTVDGYKPISSLLGEADLINADGEVCNGVVWSNGVKMVIELRLSNGEYIKCTPDHRLMNTDGEEVLAEDTKGIRLMPYYSINKEVSELTKYGFIQGDGGLGRLDSKNHLGLEINIGKNDGDILELFGLVKEDKRVYYVNGYNKVLRDLGFDSSRLPNRELPITYHSWSDYDKKMFLKGMYSANGSVIKGARIAYKTTSKELATQLVGELERLGMNPYITTNKEKEVLFSNGNYTCKKSYDVNLTRFLDVITFSKEIGFIHEYKNKALEELIKIKAPKVLDTKYIGREEVFDFSLDDDKHWGVVNGIIAHNCEIGFIPVNPKNGNSCISFCNLTEINGGLCDTPEKFYAACRSAAILGTLQASYTDMPFLGQDTKDLIEWEALIGVSITGIMDNPSVLLNEEVLRKGAAIVNKVNEEIAAIIGINPAARTTTVKPSGNASVLLGTSSGIHPAHAKKYFRVVQMNKESEVAHFLLENNPVLLEESVWSAAKNDYAIYVPVEETEGSLVKKDVSDIDFAKAVELVYKNWVLEGNHKDRGYSDRVTHNVSNTITVQNWERLFTHIYDNKEAFCGLSFMPSSGDKVYKQSPFTEVLSFEEIISLYGHGSVFASGLIVDALHAFDNDLWDACQAVIDRTFELSGDRYKTFLKKDIIRRIKKFSKNYFKGKHAIAINCLKDIYLYHKWVLIDREFKQIDFTSIPFKPTYLDVDTLGAVACAGGACEV